MTTKGGVKTGEKLGIGAGARETADAGMSAYTGHDAGETAAQAGGRADRIVGADGVRALAALGVIFSHLYQKLNAPVQTGWYQDVHAVFLHGAYGVSTFFVLSGMLLSYPFWKAYLTGGERPSLRHYARRRAARIVPGYYVSLLVSFALTFLIFPDAQYKVWRLVAGLTFTSGFHYKTFFPSATNGPLWSISLEVFSYLLLPLTLAALFWWRGRRRTKEGAIAKGNLGFGLGYWLLVIALVTVVNGLVVKTFTLSPLQRGWNFGDIGGAKEWMPGYNPLSFFAHFALGILAALFIASRATRCADKPGRGKSVWFDLIALAGLVGAAWLIWTSRFPPEPSNQDWFQNQPYQWPFFQLFIMTVLVGLAHSRWLGRAFDNRFFRYTATISFGLYIWHYLVLFWIAEVTGQQYYYGAIADWHRHLWTSAAVLAISYGIAAVSWKFIEQPALRSKWANKR